MYSFDKKYTLVNVEDSVVLTDSKNGRLGYSMEWFGETDNINNTTGEIRWKKLCQSEKRISELKHLYNISF